VGVSGLVGVGAGTINAAIALQAQSPTKGAGTIDNAFGLYVQAQTVGTNNYAIWTNGTEQSRFGGLVNAIGGFKVNGAATNHAVLLGNGTIFQASGAIPDCIDSGGNHLNYTQGTQTFACGTSGGGAPAFSAITTGTNTAATMTIGNGATLNGAAGGIVDLTSLTAATGFKVPAAAGATPSATGVLAYDSTSTTYKGYNGAAKSFAYTDTPGTTGTAPNWSSAAVLNIPMASTASVTAGLLSKTDYDAFTAKPSLVTVGTNGIEAYNAGDNTTAARSDHTHRSIHNLTWYFPGTPATGVQNMVLTIPEGVTNIALSDLRVTVATVSSGSSTFNIQRCVVSSVACSATQSTWVDIYSSVLTLAASNYTVTKGSAPNQNVGSLVAGDRFKASLVTIGASLVDVTVTMTVKYETTN
jgi:hypothetical protein